MFRKLGDFTYRDNNMVDDLGQELKKVSPSEVFLQRLASGIKTNEDNLIKLNAMKKLFDENDVVKQFVELADMRF